jgi:dTDP-4-dehydrorhamnose 3,5-epimerase
MTATETHLAGCFVIEPKVLADDRGYFFESFNQETFNNLIGTKVDFVQDNQSFSSKGVLRGLHYQKGIHAQAKLVRVISGSVLDIAVDIRQNSPTKGQYVAIELSASNYKQMFIPKGFAHGFVVLSDTAEFFYKCDNFYNKESEGGIMYDDKDLKIDWEMDIESILVSDKDKVLPQYYQIILEDF